LEKRKIKKSHPKRKVQKRMNPSPDRVFVRDLKTLDRRLGVRFNGENFVVDYNRGHGDPVIIHVVKGNDGGFRQPDKRDLEYIQSGDLEKEGFKERWQRITKYLYGEREKMRARAKDNIRGMTKDNKIQLKQAVGKVENQSKSNSAFRRINLKPKGQKF